MTVSIESARHAPDLALLAPQSFLFLAGELVVFHPLVYAILLTLQAL
jgi:hypothetical protein